MGFLKGGLSSTPRFSANNIRKFHSRLLQYVDLFLSEATGDAAPYAARLLREVFSGGPASSLQVTEGQIKVIMATVFLKSGSTISREGKVEFVRLLQELMLVSFVGNVAVSVSYSWSN